MNERPKRKFDHDQRREFKKRKKATENKRKVMATLSIYDSYPLLYAQLMLIHTLFRAVMFNKVAENTELANIEPLFLWKILG